MTCASIVAGVFSKTASFVAGAFNRPSSVARRSKAKADCGNDETKERKDSYG